MTLVRTPRSQPLRSGLEERGERGGEGGRQPKRKRGEGKLNRAFFSPRFHVFIRNVVAPE